MLRMEKAVDKVRIVHAVMVISIRGKPLIECVIVKGYLQTKLPVRYKKAVTICVSSQLFFMIKYSIVPVP